MLKAIMLCFSLFLTVNSNMSVAYPLDSIHWNHRSILFFAPENDHHVKTFVKETLMNNCLLQERDIQIVVITQDGYNKPANLFSAEDIAILSAKYDINGDSHTAILIGKDGQEKHRWGEQTNWPYITELVDSMPLRQKEIAYQPNSRCSI